MTVKLGVVLAATSLAVLGCGEDRETLGVRIAIEKLVTPEGETVPCFRKCSDSIEVPNALSARCAAPEDVDCGFAGGQDEIRVSLSYDVEVSATTSAAVPKLDLVANDVQLDPKTAFSFSAINSEGNQANPVAVARFFAPATSVDGMAFRATVPDDVVIATPSTYTVSAAKPIIAVERLVSISMDNGSQRCFAPCAEAPDVSSSLTGRCPGSATPSPCAFSAGADEIRVSVRSGIQAAVGLMGDIPKLELIGNDMALDTRATFVTVPRNTEDRRYDVLLAARLLTPLRQFDTLAFRATWANNVVAVTQSGFRVAAATPTLEIDQCPGGRCMLPSGVGSVTATLQAPPGFSGKAASFASLVSGRIADPAATKTTTLTLDSSGNASGKVDMDVPSGVGRTWTIRATLEGLEAATTTSLRAPADPLLGIAAGDTIATPGIVAIPARAVREPRSQCRAYSIAVNLPDAPNDGQVTLKSSSGTFNGKQAEATLTLDPTGSALASWILPEDDDSPTLLLNLDVADVRFAQLSVLRQPVLPVGGGGTLSARQRVFNVAATGIPDDVVLNGALQSVPGARFPSSATLAVRTRVISSPADALPCGTPIAPSIVKCDPTAATIQERGACFLTPFSTAVRPDGSYSIVVNGGFCFAGELEITALSQIYTAVDGAKCLGELARSEGVVEVGSVGLVFESSP